MPLLMWKDEYSVKVDLFDEQHKKMFGYVNDLIDAINEIQEHAVLRQILHDLILYTKNHFNDEEFILYKYNYPAYIKHKKEHDELTSQVIKYALSFCSNPDLSGEILAFLSGWIINHILDSDMDYAEFLSGKEIKIPK